MGHIPFHKVDKYPSIYPSDSLTNRYLEQRPANSRSVILGIEYQQMLTAYKNLFRSSPKLHTEVYYLT